MQNNFDVTILSTWEDEKGKVENLNGLEIVWNIPPPVPGFSHRNYQRLSTASALKRAAELNCTHVLKWRTDMIPTKIDINKLIEWANFDVPEGFPSRIVTCAYRNYTVSNDWFSSIPDLFAFGDINMMQLLWGDNGFNYSLERNMPKQMIIETGDQWVSDDITGNIWCAESELYAIFKDRLQHKTNKVLTHDVIAKKYMRLVDHNKLGIIWFGKNGFRPIFQAWEHQWWTEDIWRRDKNPKKGNYAYQVKGIESKIKRRLSTLISLFELCKQKSYYYKLQTKKQMLKLIP